VKDGIGLSVFTGNGAASSTAPPMPVSDHQMRTRCSGVRYSVSPGLG